MNNVYGTNRPAVISSSDVEIFYHYRPSRSETSSDFGEGFKKLENGGISATKLGDSTDTIPGMYNLTLDVNTFNRKGIYTLYIKPKEIRSKILDVSTLAAFPNIKGVVIDTSNLDGINSVNGSLVGYRIEYFNDSVRSEVFRIITSNNKCEPISQNLNDSNQKGIRYRFNDSSNLMFCTVTPSVGNTFKNNSEPYIGSVGQEIALINTKFNPFAIEIEMVEHDVETISYMLEGDQIRNLERGIITTFDENGEIYHQSITGTAIDPDGGETHDFKFSNKNTINYNEGKNLLDSIKDNL